MDMNDLASTHSSRTVQLLNERFRAGRPSHSLTAAGIVARAFDSAQLSPAGRAWIADTSVGGIVSASLISRQLPYLYAGDAWHTPEQSAWGQMGVVLSDAAASARG